jgi:hypothetical protein
MPAQALLMRFDTPILKKTTFQKDIHKYFLAVGAKVCNEDCTTFNLTRSGKNKAKHCLGL